MKITIINPSNSGNSYTRISMEEFCKQLADGTYRQAYPNDVKKEVCFATEWQKQKGTAVAKADNHLLLLDLENLDDLTTVIEYKRAAAPLPYTLLAFIGHDGHSLHVVCRYNGDRDAAYSKLHFIYSSQLGTPFAPHQPSAESSCLVSYDPEPIYNPAAMTLTATPDDIQTPAFRIQQEAISDYQDPEEIPGMSVNASRMHRFHSCLNAAIEANSDIQDEEDWAAAVLEHLADNCHQAGIPEPFAARLAAHLPMIASTREVIPTVFQTAYLRKQLKARPMKFTSKSALLIYKTEAYLNTHYVLRKNVMTGIVEFKDRAYDYTFQPLDAASRKSMAISALKAGVESWDKDLDRYLDSTLVPKYYPLADFLDHLPSWDGRDRVEELARCVKTANPHWPAQFHVWMLSMVAQWTGKNRQHGNAIVPVLIGPQGSGKTTFCRRLLPEYLQTYYNDRIPMKNDTDINLAMASYALINIDEFDVMKRSQQPLLKYLISKHDVKMRPPYGKFLEQRDRFASFIATTNNRRPLIDPTGSRRFLCVYAPSIDNTGRIDHSQLYAQLLAELNDGRRYWFEQEDNELIMKQNEAFRQVKELEDMILLTYRPAKETNPQAPFVLLSQIVDRLQNDFPTFPTSKNISMSIGRQLKAMGYKHHHSMNGATYRIEPLVSDENPDVSPTH